MSGKFSTTSSSLFNNDNPGQLPEWMQNLHNVEIKEREAMDLGIEAKGAFAEKQTVYRDEIVGTPRYLEAGFNDTKLATDAKILLAKFLAGKYYETDPKVAGSSVSMHTKIGGVAGSFVFSYVTKEGKLSPSNTFAVTTEGGEYADYPFNKGGFEECLADLRSNKVKVARKVLSGAPSMITLEEIVRRFNGDHRKAMDTARELVEAGDIIGVGSNTYASMYSMDDLFPRMEKEAAEPRLPEFHFAPNREHVAANPHTSAKVLAIDASKTLAEFFSDFRIASSSRDHEELLVKANVMTEKGVLENADFCFGIENDHVASVKFVEFRNERMTVDQMLQKMNMQSNVLDAYLRDNPTTAKRIYRGVVLTAKEIHRRLNKIANKDTVASIIENWTERGLITPVNSTTFTTTASFEDLLASVNTKVLTADEAAEITAQQRTFGAGLDFDRQDVKDTGFRNDQELEVSEEIRLANLYNELSKHFQNFKILDFDGNNGLIAVDTAMGSQPAVEINAEFEGNAVKKVTGCFYRQDNPKVEISRVMEALKHSPVLSKYVQDNPGRKFVASSVISMGNLRRSLAKVIKAEAMEAVIREMIQERKLVNIGGDMYASAYPISKLLGNNIAAFKGQMSDADRKEVNAAMAHFGSALEREDVQDTGVRDMIVEPTDENILQSANSFLAQHFSNFQAQNYDIDGENLQYVVSMFDPETGLRTNVQFVFNMNGAKVASCKVKLNNGMVSLDNVKQAFATNEVLKKYLDVNPGKRVDAPMIMTVNSLVRKMATVTGADLKEIEETIAQWDRSGRITQIATNAFASRYTIEQLLSMSNLKPLSEAEFTERIARAQRERLAKVSAAHEKDADTRAMEVTWTPEKLASYFKAEISKKYNDVEFFDFCLENNKYVVTARVYNDDFGLRGRGRFCFANLNGKPGALQSGLNITVSTNDLEALVEFKKYNSTDKRLAGKSIVTMKTLRDKLSAVMEVDKVQEAVEFLCKEGSLKAVSETSFATEATVPELLEKLINASMVNIEAAKEQRKLAARDEGTIQMPTTVVMNTGSRVVEANEKTLSPKMLELRDKMLKNVSNAHTGKLITANKFNQYKLALEAAKTEKELENVWKDFKKYLG